TRKAQTPDEFMAWATCAEMVPIFDDLAAEALRMKEDMGSDVAGPRGLWLLLAVEAVCRQERSVGLKSNDAEMLVGVEIISEMLLTAAVKYGKPEPFTSQGFWR